MNGTGVIDRFLDVFTRYIDSGFGLLGSEVAFLAATLIVIDITLAALFWAWGADDDIIARLIKKTLFVGVFAWIIGNWNFLGPGHLRQLRRPRPRRLGLHHHRRNSCSSRAGSRRSALMPGGRCSRPSPG